MAALPGMLEDDRKQAGWSVGYVAWRLGVSVREYREIEAGERWPNWETVIARVLKDTPKGGASPHWW